MTLIINFTIPSEKMREKQTTLKFVFDRKKTATKEKKGLLQIEIYNNGKRKFVSTGVKLYSDQWDNRKMVINHYDAQTINKDLLGQMDMWIKKTDAYTFSGVLDFEMLEGSCKVFSGNFFDYAYKMVETMGYAKGTANIYYTILNNLKAFGKIIYFEDLDKKRIEAFETYLKEKGCKQTSINLYHSKIDAIIRHAIRNGIEINNPYKHYQLKKAKSAGRKHLTIEQVKMLEELQLDTKKLQLARDLFLIQCYTGFAYADLMSFDKSKMEKRGDKYVYLNNRVKTEKPYYIVIMDRVYDILQKYNFEIPFIANGCYIARLNKISTMVGFGTLSSHIGRHTFAVMALNNGVRIESVSKILGHTSIKTTQIYAKIVDKQIESDFELLESRLK